MAAGEHKNPTSALMELAAKENKIAVFNSPFSTGFSHQPRFLCQWQYGGQAFPGVFSSSKKEGKALAALIVLDELSPYSFQKRRPYVTFKAEGVAHTLVDQSTVGGIDSRLFTDSKFHSLNESKFHQTKNGNSLPQEYRLNPLHGASVPQMPCPPEPSSGRGKMQAFDFETIAALARRPTLSNMTAASITSAPPLTLPELEYSATSMATGASDSLDISKVLKDSLRSENLSTLETMDTDRRPLTVDSNISELTMEPSNGAAAVKTELAAVRSSEMELCNGLDSLAIKPEGGRGIATPPENTAMEVKFEKSGAVIELEPGKNAISALHELGQKIGVKPEFQVLSRSGPPHLPTFECQCVFDDVKATVHSRSKGEGKLDAFNKVLERINQTERLRNSVLNGVMGRNEMEYNPSRNPISEVMELGNKLSIVPSFKCVQVSVTPVSQFDGWCVFGDEEYGPISGRNKQETKTKAFQHALSEITQDPSIRSRLSRLQHGIISSVSPEISPQAGGTSSNGISFMSPESVQNLLSQKHPVSAFLEYAQGRRMVAEFVEVEISGPPHCRNFQYKCTLNGASFPAAAARTRKEAKKHAAELALRALAEKASSSTSSRLLEFRQEPPERARSLKNNNGEDAAGPNSLAPMPPLAIASRSDKIAQEVLIMFTKLKSCCGVDLGKVILAGFVIENTNNDKFTIISIGTGNKCISGQHLSMDGKEVSDCHAEVIARRGLLRFFYANIRRFNSEPSKSIFDKEEGSELLSLKPHLFLHLYISTAPCGDGAIFTHNDSTTDLASYNVDDEHSPTLDMPSHGQLRSKMEVGEGTIPTTTATSPIQTYDGIGRGDRLKTMSCSDKICKWNVLGVQGTLLTHLLKPVYISSMVLGQLFHPGHLSRALCCRIESFNDSLVTDKSRFRLNHMKIDRTTQLLQRSIAKSKPISLNWVKGDSGCELLDAESGQVIPSTDKSADNDMALISRVSKICLYRQYLEIRPPPADHAGPLSYHDAKLEIEEYSQTKEQLYQAFTKLGYGYWVRKPPELSMFQL